MKVGIIISRDFFGNHVGVRNYVLALGTLLAEKARVDYLSRLPNEGGSAQWYALQPLPPQCSAAHPKASAVHLEGTPREMFPRYLAVAEQPPPHTPSMPHAAIGSDLAVEQYDVLIVSAPWVVEFDGRLPAKRVIGLAFDTIPNTIGFTTWDIRPFSFGGIHARGYRYYQEHADLVYAISRDTASSLAALFRIPEDRLAALPPFLPIGYLNRAVPDVERGPNLVLAAPFDPRKGLADMPALVNPSAPVLGRLLIYGQPRCPAEMVAKFFNELDPQIRVEWRPQATVDEVMSMFASSRLLLFPSVREGLGLPLLEAQVCGTRVASHPIPPMADNMLDGSIALGPSPSADAARVAAALSDAGFDHAGLKRIADEKFSFDHIRRSLQTTTGHVPPSTHPRADRTPTGADDGVPRGPADSQLAGSSPPRGAAGGPLPRAGGDGAAAVTGR